MLFIAGTRDTLSAEPQIKNTMFSKDDAGEFNRVHHSETSYTPKPQKTAAQSRHRNTSISSQDQE